MATSLSSLIDAYEQSKALKETIGLLKTIGDLETTEEKRREREKIKEEDQWIAIVVDILNNLDGQQKALQEAYDIGMASLKKEKESIIQETQQMGFSIERVSEYQRNSMILRRIPEIKSDEDAANLARSISGVEQIRRFTFDQLLDEGKKITRERAKKNREEAYDEILAQRMVPVLLRCEFKDDVGQLIIEYFLALHDSFARKMLQDIKERLKSLRPPTFKELAYQMETEADMNASPYDLFLQVPGEGSLVLRRVCIATMWNKEGKPCAHAIFFERRLDTDELHIKQVLAENEDGNQLAQCIDWIYKYKAHVLPGGERIPELRGIPGSHKALRIFITKVLTKDKWQKPDPWPVMPYPQEWREQESDYRPPVDSGRNNGSSWQPTDLKFKKVGTHGRVRR